MKLTMLASLSVLLSIASLNEAKLSKFDTEENQEVTDYKENKNGVNSKQNTIYKENKNLVDSADEQVTTGNDYRNPNPQNANKDQFAPKCHELHWKKFSNKKPFDHWQLYPQCQPDIGPVTMNLYTTNLNGCQLSPGKTLLNNATS